MAFGLNFEGLLGNALFSDKTPSVAFMGKASSTGVYGDRTSHGGLMELNTNNNPGSGYWRCAASKSTYLKFTAGTSPHVSLKNSTSTKVTNWCPDGSFCGCLLAGTPATYTFDVVDHSRTLDYEVEAYEKPVVFTHFASPGLYGALVIKTVGKGTTGPRGYPMWTITVLLYYATAGNHATAASNIELYCFSAIPPTSPTNPDWGMHIKNLSGATMFHSDFKPCHIRELLTITTGTNPSTNFASYLLDSSGSRMPSKPCYLSQDWGRVRGYTVIPLSGANVRMQQVRFPFSIEHVSGENFVARFGETTISDYYYTSTAKSPDFVGASTVVWPVVNGADYD